MLRSSKCAGSVLVELLISVLLMSIAVSSLMGSLLQSSGQTGHLQRKEQAGLQSNSVLQSLKNYVTPDPSAATQGNAPNGCWNFRDAQGNCPTACPAGCANTCPSTCPLDCWALSDGQHNMPLDPNSDLANPKYGATISYTVSNCGKNVAMNVQWNEP